MLPFWMKMDMKSSAKPEDVKEHKNNLADVFIFLCARMHACVHVCAHISVHAYIHVCVWRGGGGWRR